MVYANQFPEYENSDFIMKKYADTFNNPYRKFLKSEPSELFTLHPMLITKWIAILYDYFKEANDKKAWELFQTVLGGTNSILDYLQTNVEPWFL